MNKNIFIEFIKNNFPGASLASGGKEIVVHCPYCEGSRSTAKHGHMYIRVPSSDADAPLFNCFKCHSTGVLNSSKLLEWGKYDPLMGSTLDNIIKESAKKNKFKGYAIQRYMFYNNFCNQNLADLKIKYIYDRIGVNLSYADCFNNKIILNLKEAIDYEPNHIYKYTRHENILNQLNDNFVGFLSVDNNFVNLRRICKEGIVYQGIDKRYINYNIHGKEDNTEKQYVLPVTIDLSIPQRVQFHISEGPFDILSIRYNLRPYDLGIFAAATGSGYRALLMHLIVACKIFLFDVHVYPDNDEHGDIRMIRDLYDYIKPYGARLFVHRNMKKGEKDFGVPINRIEEYVSEYIE